MDLYYYDPSYKLLVAAVHKIVSLADELIEQNNFLTKFVHDLDGQNLSPDHPIPTRDMVSVLLQNYSGQRHATSEHAKMELLIEAINNLSKLADLFVTRNNYLIQRIYAHFGKNNFDTNGYIN